MFKPPIFSAQLLITCSVECTIKWVHWFSLVNSWVLSLNCFSCSKPIEVLKYLLSGICSRRLHWAISFLNVKWVTLKETFTSIYNDWNNVMDELLEMSSHFLDFFFMCVFAFITSTLLYCSVTLLSRDPVACCNMDSSYHINGLIVAIWH